MLPIDDTDALQNTYTYNISEKKIVCWFKLPNTLKLFGFPIFLMKVILEAHRAH